MGEAAGLREKATHSRLAAGRTGGGGPHSTSEQWRTLKGALTLGGAPPCNDCSQNFSDGKLTTCHLTHPVVGQVQLMGKGLLPVLCRHVNMKWVQGRRKGWMGVEEHGCIETEG